MLGVMFCNADGRLMGRMCRSVNRILFAKSRLCSGLIRTAVPCYLTRSPAAPGARLQLHMTACSQPPLGAASRVPELW
jgi:hypothetical protein